MSIGWQIFRIICLLQMLMTTYFTFSNLMRLFNKGQVQFFWEALAFGLVGTLSVFALSVLNANYPDKPIAGKQKSTFNWLYLLNFILLAFLFGLFFSTINFLKEVSTVTGKEIFSLPFSNWIPTIVCSAMLIFHFIILYGLFILRRLLFLNHHLHQQDFEFEKE
jgi:hypothetical protein